MKTIIILAESTVNRAVLSLLEEEDMQGDHLKTPWQALPRVVGRPVIFCHGCGTTLWGTLRDKVNEEGII